MIEVSTLSTTHRNIFAMAEFTVGRCFISLPAHAIPNMETLLIASDAPLEGPDGMDSDHAIMHLRIRPKQQRPPAERGIPALIFDSPHYQHHIEKLLDMIDISAMTPMTKWKVFKTAMTEAAQLARNTTSSIATAELNSQSDPIAKEVRAMTLGSIARAIWFQDTRLATAMIDNAELAANRPQ
eukprot:502038-Pyramimonas_sp.AAC.1